MIVTTVIVYVKEEYIDDFIEATRKNHLESVKEKGNMRFDVLQSKDNTEKFLLYEAYESAEASAAHKNTEHYLAWKEAVASWMAKPREGIPYRVVYPSERDNGD